MVRMRLGSSISSVLLLALFFISVVCAVDPNAHLHHLHKRQDQSTPVGTGRSSAATPSSAVESESAAESTSSSARVTTSSSSPLPTSSAPPPTTLISTTEEDDDESTPTPTPTSETPTPTPETTPTTPVESQTALITTTADQPSDTAAPVVTTTIVTVSGSSTISRVITSSAASSSQPTGTESPSLNGGEGGSGSSGISDSQRRIIIGVVVGIGGAILIGALAVVAWRIWGRKKHDTDDDDLYDPNSSIKDKSSSVSGANPFKSTLDQYHNPAPVNTASNF